MTESSYAFAALSQEDVDRLRELEKQLSDRNGCPVTLIAYGPPSEDAGDRTRSDC